VKNKYDYLLNSKEIWLFRTISSIVPEGQDCTEISFSKLIMFILLVIFLRRIALIKIRLKFHSENQM
jgi:hypothetical protein